MAIRPEVIPFIIASIAIGLFLGGVVRACRRSRKAAVWTGLLVAVILGVYMLFFFRDPVRVPPADSNAVLAGADGVVARIRDVPETQFIGTNCVRISIFLSLFDVHVNRAPIGGTIKFLGYFPGKRFFTFQEKSSEFNQHNSILIEGRTRCLVNQIVGPVARRVVYWLTLNQEVTAGDPIGMMKFGSRLDMYFPKDDVTVRVKEGDRVRAGETIVAELNRNPQL
jgi:phosphatidylserine decarboxylase